MGNIYGLKKKSAQIPHRNGYHESKRLVNLIEAPQKLHSEQSNKGEKFRLYTVNNISACGVIRFRVFLQLFCLITILPT